MIYTKKVIGTIGYMGGVAALLEKFCWSWGQMIQYNTEYLCRPGEIIHYTRATVSFHSFARNSIVEQMQGDWLLMLDTDHAFEPDLATRMINMMNKFNIDVGCGVYCHRTPPHSPVLYQWNKEGEALEPIGDWDRSVEAFEIGSSGAGSLCIRRSVFERIDEELKENPFDIIHPLGEDNSFFKRLKRLGIKAYAFPHIESPHIYIDTLKLDNYKKQNVYLKKRNDVGGYK